MFFRKTILTHTQTEPVLFYFKINNRDNNTIGNTFKIVC